MGEWWSESWGRRFLLLLLGTVFTRRSRREAVFVVELAVAGSRCSVCFLRRINHPGRLCRRVSGSRCHMSLFALPLEKV
jgi:hypothetical protein